MAPRPVVVRRLIAITRVLAGYAGLVLLPTAMLTKPFAPTADMRLWRVAAAGLVVAPIWAALSERLRGVYGDSLACEVDDRDPGSLRRKELEWRIQRARMAVISGAAGMYAGMIVLSFTCAIVGMRSEPRAIGLVPGLVAMVLAPFVPRVHALAKALVSRRHRGERAKVLATDDAILMLELRDGTRLAVDVASVRGSAVARSGRVADLWVHRSPSAPPAQGPYRAVRGVQGVTLETRADRRMRLREAASLVVDVLALAIVPIAWWGIVREIFERSLLP